MRQLPPLRLLAGIERQLDLAEDDDAFDLAQVRRIPEDAREAVRRRLRAAIERLEGLQLAIGGAEE